MGSMILLPRKGPSRNLLEIFQDINNPFSSSFKMVATHCDIYACVKYKGKGTGSLSCQKYDKEPRDPQSTAM